MLQPTLLGTFLTGLGITALSGAPSGPLPHQAAADGPGLVATFTQRSVYAQAIGFDYEYDDGIGALDESQEPLGPWLGVADADLYDYWGSAVARGLAVADTQAGQAELQLHSSSHSTTAGNHFSADSLAESGCTVELHIEGRVRVQLTATTTATLGYNEAHVTLSASTNPLPIAQAASSPWLSAPNTLHFTGWLTAGTYVLDASTSALAYGSTGTLDGQSASLDVSLHWYHQADFDLSGSVDFRDLRSFRRAHSLGVSDSDWDGDGLIEHEDLVAFASAWRRGR